MRLKTEKMDNKLSANLSLSVGKLAQLISVFSYYFIAVVLLASGIGKVIEPSGFLNTLNSSFSFLGENIVILIASVIPLMEVSIGILLLLKIRVKEALHVACGLFGLFTLFAIYGFAYGLEDDCGCFGTTLGSEFGIGMIIRNSIFFTLSIISLKYFKETIPQSAGKNIP